MRAWLKAVSGLLAFGPLVSALGIGCVIGYAVIVHDLETGGSGVSDPIDLLLDGPFDATDWAILAVVAVGVALLELVLTTLFAIHAAKHARLGNLAVLGWLVAFVMVGPFALPLYFVLHMLRDPVRRVELPEIP